MLCSVLLIFFFFFFFPQLAQSHFSCEKCTTLIKIAVFWPLFISLQMTFSFFSMFCPLSAMLQHFLFLLLMFCVTYHLPCMYVLLDQAFLSHSISLSLPLAMCSSSGVAGDHHAAATAGAGSSITGYPYHGKLLRPQTAPYISLM